MVSIRYMLDIIIILQIGDGGSEKVSNTQSHSPGSQVPVAPQGLLCPISLFTTQKQGQMLCLLLVPIPGH